MNQVLNWLTDNFIVFWWYFKGSEMTAIDDLTLPHRRLKNPLFLATFDLFLNKFFKLHKKLILKGRVQGNFQPYDRIGLKFEIWCTYTIK